MASWRLRRHIGAIRRLRRQKWPKNDQKWSFLAKIALFLARRIQKLLRRKAKMTILESFLGVKAFRASKGVTDRAIHPIKSGKSAFPPTLGVLEQLLGPKYTLIFHFGQNGLNFDLKCRFWGGKSENFQKLESLLA